MSFKQLLTFNMLQRLLYFEKNCEIIYIRSQTLVFENMPKIISIGLVITYKRPLKNWKFSLFWGAKIKKIWHFQFPVSQIFWQTFFVSENLKCTGQLLWKLRAVQLAIVSLNLEKFNNRQRESCKLTSTLFWKLVSKVVPGRSFKIFDPVIV